MLLRHADVLSAIVDEDGTARIQAGSLDEQLVDPGIRLHHAYLPRDDDLLKEREEAVALASYVESLCGPVGQRVQRVTGGMELPEYPYRALEALAEHLVPAKVVRLDLVSVFGVFGAQELYHLLERTAAIQLGVPLWRADRGEERFYLLFAVEDAPVEVPRVPVDEYPA